MDHSPLIYLDHAASSPLRHCARAAYLGACEYGGNASSIHALGRKANAIVEASRAAILDHLGGHNHGLVFTSGGTESNNLALHQARVNDIYSTLIIGDGEHDSLFATSKTIQKTKLYAPLTPEGDIDIMVLSQQLEATDGKPFVCIGWVNNETGVINNIAKIAELVKAKGGWLHVDAVQALGKMEINLDTVAIDSLSIAAHKIGGPQGVGALIYRREHALRSVIMGGGQEFALRAGTQNVAGIAGFSEALSECLAENKEKAIALTRVQDEIEVKLMSQSIVIVGKNINRVTGVMCMAQSKWSSALQLIQMDLNRICVSSGSACSSGKVKPSRILQSMGLGEVAGGALRISTGWTNAPEDLNRFFQVWSNAYETYLRRHFDTINAKENV